MDRQSQSQARRFEQIVGPHFTALYRAALRLTRCREDAEDLVQEVSLKALPELGRLATLESPRGWLLRVQYHLFVDGVRRRLRSPVTAVDDPAARVHGSGDVTMAAEGIDLGEAHDQQQRLAQAWRALNRKQRALLALHAEGYSLTELAQITGLSNNAVGVRLHRARAALAQGIKDESTHAGRLAGLEA
jgi:RNA polymerase sigma-70 factor (ECF subfamily)